MPRALFALLTVLLLALPARAATSLYDRQLVYNGAAELDEGALDPAKAQPVIGWHPVPGSPPIRALRYGAHGVFPKPDSPGASYHGRNFFWGGYTARASAYQDIDLRPIAADIDRRIVTFRLGAWLGGRQRMGDHATVNATFMDASGMSLGGAYIGPVTPADRDGTTSFLYRETTRLVPAGTRTARITIVMVREEGDTNDGYVDSISFTVHKAQAPAH